jgi:hypothetical protein
MKLHSRARAFTRGPMRTRGHSSPSRPQPYVLPNRGTYRPPLLRNQILNAPPLSHRGRAPAETTGCPPIRLARCLCGARFQRASGSAFNKSAVGTGSIALGAARLCSARVSRPRRNARPPGLHPKHSPRSVGGGATNGGKPRRSTVERISPADARVTDTRPPAAELPIRLACRCLPSPRAGPFPPPAA